MPIARDAGATRELDGEPAGDARVARREGLRLGEEPDPLGVVLDPALIADELPPEEEVVGLGADGPRVGGARGGEAPATSSAI